MINNKIKYHGECQALKKNKPPSLVQYLTTKRLQRISTGCRIGELTKTSTNTQLVAEKRLDWIHNCVF